MTADLTFRVIFLVCLAVAIVGTCFAGKRFLRLGIIGCGIALLPYVYPILIVAWGLLFMWHGAEDTEPAWRPNTTMGLALVLYTGLCAFSIWRSRGARLFVIAHIPLSFCIAIIATVFAIACVTGD
jgi:hypothetical protein